MISIITINLNNYFGLVKTFATIKALKSISESRFQWVVVDGGSVDGSLAFLHYHSLHDKISVGQDSGIYDAMNTGLDLAAGQYVIFLNSGDYLEGDLSALDNPDHSFYFGYRLNFRNFYTLGKKPLLGLPTSHQAIVFPASSIRYSLSYQISSDYKYYLDHLSAGFSFSYQSSLFAVIEPGGISSNRKRQRRFESASIRSEYFGFIGIVASFLVILLGELKTFFFVSFLKYYRYGKSSNCG